MDWDDFAGRRYEGDCLTGEVHSMLRMLLAEGVLAAIVLTTGCRMGEHPYDCCGPVWSQGRCLNCNPDYRAGSAFSGGPAPGQLEPAAANTGGEPAPGPAEPTAKPQAAFPNP
jgi:hypothetical protein